MNMARLERDLSSNDNYGRMTRVYRYLRDNGRSSRDRIMHFTGFPSPLDQPICAYVEFENAIMRLDRILRRHGMGVHTTADERYQIVGNAP